MLLGKKFLHTDAFRHKRLYTQTLLHADMFTWKRLGTHTLLHTDTFTHRRFYKEKLLHTETFTHRHFYTEKSEERRRACYSLVSSIKDIVGESFIEDDADIADDQQKGDRNTMSDSKQK